MLEMLTFHNTRLLWLSENFRAVFGPVRFDGQGLVFGVGLVIDSVFFTAMYSITDKPFLIV